jgi:hypothetical protein
MIIYSLWIAGKLSPLNNLCIKSFQEQGHEIIIYSFDDSIDPGCEVRDAARILPKDEVYYYKHLGENFKFGGIAERLKAEMLYNLGGWHVDLDVVCLSNFQDISSEYVLRPHSTGVVGNIIKAPAFSKLAGKYVSWTREITSENRDWEKSFRGLTFAVNDLGLQQYIVDSSIFGTDDSSFWMPFLNTTDTIPNVECKAIHFCGAMKYYENYVKGSFYEQLLQKYKLI